MRKGLAGLISTFEEKGYLPKSAKKGVGEKKGQN
jgi:hypothetical protein